MFLSFFKKYNFLFPMRTMHVPYKDGGERHNFHGTGKKLYSQNEKLIGQSAGHSIKVLFVWVLLKFCIFKRLNQVCQLQYC